MLRRRHVPLCLKITLACARTPRRALEFPLKVHGRRHAMRNRNDDVNRGRSFRGQLGVMLFNPRMFAYAVMSLFPGGSAQNSKTGSLSIGCCCDVAVIGGEVTQVAARLLPM